jgi:pimeloyl-ACP methyl ester carboxylesterase
MQLVDWPEPLLGGLVQAGYFLIMPDLRDAGCSTKLDKLGLPDWSRILGEMAAGRRASPDYSVDDMVSDMSAVLDAEGVKSAHVLGASGGSLIAEVMAMQRPLRVRSLTLLMANAGNPARAIPANPRLMSSVAQTPISTDELELENYLASLERVLTGPNAPGEAVLRRRAQVRIARGYSSNGVQRQGAAFLASGDLRQQLTMVSVPTTVIHGAEDPLIPVDAGRDVALSVPNARFQVLPRSGHALDPDMVAAALQALQQGTLEKKRR